MSFPLAARRRHGRVAGGQRRALSRRPPGRACAGRAPRAPRGRDPGAPRAPGGLDGPLGRPPPCSWPGPSRSARSAVSLPAGLARFRFLSLRGPHDDRQRGLERRPDRPRAGRSTTPGSNVEERMSGVTVAVLGVVVVAAALALVVARRRSRRGPGRRPSASLRRPRAAPRRRRAGAAARASPPAARRERGERADAHDLVGGRLVHPARPTAPRAAWRRCTVASGGADDEGGEGDARGRAGLLRRHRGQRALVDEGVVDPDAEAEDPEERQPDRQLADRARRRARPRRRGARRPP